MREKSRKVRQLFLHSVRLLFTGYETMLLLGFGLGILFAMLFAMDDVKEEKSNIVIGIADEDGSEFSKRVIDRLCGLSGYEIVEGKQNELLTLLQKGDLSAVGVIREGYQENVLLGETDDLIVLYETEEGNLLLTDVLAGAMIQEICNAKSYALFKKYMQERGEAVPETEADFQRLAAEYFDDTMYDFSFETEYVLASGEAGETPENTVIYVQVIFAIAAMMMGFLAVYSTMPYHRFCHGRMARKMKTLPFERGMLFGVTGFAGLCLPTGFGAVFLAAFAVRNRQNFSDYMAFFICTLVYCCVIVGILLLFATVVASRQAYQLGMTALLLVFSVFGLISIVDGLLLPEGISTWIPNGAYVRKMMELYQK